MAFPLRQVNTNRNKSHDENSCPHAGFIPADNQLSCPVPVQKPSSESGTALAQGSNREAFPCQSIVVLTGAGIFGESGLATFRDAGGLWAKVCLEDVATHPGGFRP